MSQCLADGLFLTVSHLKSSTMSPRWLHTVLPDSSGMSTPKSPKPQPEPWLSLYKRLDKALLFKSRNCTLLLGILGMLEIVQQR